VEPTTSKKIIPNVSWNPQPRRKLGNEHHLDPGIWEEKKPQSLPFHVGLRMSELLQSNMQHEFLYRTSDYHYTSIEQLASPSWNLNVTNACDRERKAICTWDDVVLWPTTSGSLTPYRQLELKISILFPTIREMSA